MIRTVLSSLCPFSGARVFQDIIVQTHCVLICQRSITELPMWNFIGLIQFVMLKILCTLKKKNLNTWSIRQVLKRNLFNPLCVSMSVMPRNINNSGHCHTDFPEMTSSTSYLSGFFTASQQLLELVILFPPHVKQK